MMLKNKHSIQDLENQLGYTFNNKSLIKQALSHSSYTYSSKVLKNINSNERLEFLGDRVLGLAVAHKLYEVFSNQEEGALATSIAYLNSKDVLCKVAEDIKLFHYIFISGIKRKKSLKSIYANALEAVLAAIYLDSDFKTVQKVIDKLWHPYVENSVNCDTKVSFNPKSILQEWAQKNNLPLPLYKDIKKEGSEHEPMFTVNLLIEGYEVIVAKAPSKREAQKIAAYNFLKNNNIILQG